MRLVIQRVKHASCTIDGVVHSKIEKGFCVFVGFTHDDTKELVSKMVRKLSKLRVFEDEEGKMNRSLEDVNGSILSISQFTLYASCKKGNRPGFTDAARPEIAIPLYDFFNEEIANTGIPVQTGVFGADMKIDLLNDGPITIIYDSKEMF
ncbi:MAG: D-tyrosyl-tRNA(Tyr) deacylase [Firmicutes bacterium]|nr:D-tyrosyl-tRNA(Tyr) deacylase [Bacillota bacterium]